MLMHFNAGPKVTLHLYSSFLFSTRIVGTLHGGGDRFTSIRSQWGHMYTVPIIISISAIWTCHGWSRCSGIWLASVPDTVLVTKWQTVLSAPVVTGSIVMRIDSAYFGTVMTPTTRSDPERIKEHLLSPTIYRRLESWPIPSRKFQNTLSWEQKRFIV